MNEVKAGQLWVRLDSGQEFRVLSVTPFKIKAQYTATKLNVANLRRERMLDETMFKYVGEANVEAIPAMPPRRIKLEKRNHLRVELPVGMTRKDIEKILHEMSGMSIYEMSARCGVSDRVLAHFKKEQMNAGG